MRSSRLVWIAWLGGALAACGEGEADEELDTATSSAMLDGSGSPGSTSGSTMSSAGPAGTTGSTGSAGDAGPGGETSAGATESGGSSGTGSGTTGTPGGGDPSQASCEGRAPEVLEDPTMVESEAELRAALAVGGDIQVTADITATDHFEVAADTVLDGGGFTISGGGSTHLFVGERVDFTLQNATLVDGNNQVDDREPFRLRSGAAVMMSGGSGEGPQAGRFTAIDVTFEGHRAKPTGPGDIRGGAVYLFALPNATLSGCTFVDNQASNGGAVGGLGSSIEIINSSFIDNATNATGDGDALEGRGGAISLDALSQNGQTAYLRICGTEFRDNTAYRAGGAISLVTHWFEGNEFVIDRSLFAGNSTTAASEGQGGAIYTLDDSNYPMPSDPVPSRTAVSNSLFVGNETLGGGGIWYFTEDGQLDLTNVTFVDNEARREVDRSMGGALAVVNGPANIANCTFARNYATFHGGGIQAGGDAVVRVQNTIFYNNTSNRANGFAWFHANRELDEDGGGNVQWLDPDLEIDVNSNNEVVPGITLADPQLGELADNGGPTWTMALPEGSPAVDAGVADGAPDEDARGVERDGLPDAGAFERGPED